MKEDKRYIGFEVKTLSHLIKRHMDQIQADNGGTSTTGVQGWLLYYLYEHRNEVIFQKDIEEEFSIRRSTATGILQLMEKKGLILRQPVEQDARMKRLVLTDDAAVLHQKIVKEVEQMEAQLCAGLTQIQLEQFFAVLDQVKNNLEQMPGFH